MHHHHTVARIFSQDQMFRNIRTRFALIKVATPIASDTPKRADQL